MNDLWLRIRAIFLRTRVERELDDELAFHIEMQARKYVASGMGEEEAQRRARVEFGARALVQEECRDQRRVNLIETMVQDVRYALRGYARTPTFALTVIATIALGLGINIAVFTIFNAYVLRPIAVHDPYSLYEVDWVNRSGGFSLTSDQFDEFQKENPVFSETFGDRNLQLRVDGHMTYGELVSGNYFRMLGVGAAVGRTLVPSDSAAPGREPVAVLSYDAWQGKYGADPEIVGKKIFVRGFPLEVVGVAPEGFTGLNEMPQDFWAPLSMLGQVDPDRGVRLRVYGRIRHGLSVQQAEAALALIAQRMTAGAPQAERATGAVLRSRATAVHLTANGMAVVSPVIAAFVLVLLIACANVANMMLARSMARQREIGIRLSLGAARSRLIRQLLTESVLLAIPAAILGFAISQAVIEGGTRIMFATLPAEFVEYLRIVPLAPDTRVFLFMMGAVVIAALLFGLAPALQATRASVVQAARGDFTNEYRPGRLRNALVIVQITGCAALLISAGVLLRGANRVRGLETGMRTRDVIEIEVQEKSRARVLARLAADPLVDSIGASALSPLDDWFPVVPASPVSGAAVLPIPFDFVSPEYFGVFDIPVLQGRSFAADEAASGAAVTVISQAAAHRLWPDRDAVGQRLELQPNSPTRLPQVKRFHEVRVIGVVRDTVTGYLDDEAARSCIYLPTKAAAEGSVLMIRIHGDAESARQKLDATLSREQPASVEEIHKMQEFVVGRQYPFRAAYWVSAAIGIVALLLTVVGIYGVMSYLVAQRTKEIGIRMAMGASARQVVLLVLKQSTRLTLAGLAIGTTLALGASQFFTSRLTMIRLFDSWAYLAGAGLVFLACAAAAFFPSRRAARVDPIATLRYD
jgi:predicted permease